MQDKKSIYLITTITSLLMIAIFVMVHFIAESTDKSRESVIVGFIYDGDESTPYTANLIKAQKAVELKYGDRVKVIVKSNVHSKDGGEQAMKELIAENCDLIFATSFDYGETAKRLAGENPEIQFCQASCMNANDEPVYENYHTFMGEIYEGRYASGVIAGMKLKEMIEKGTITKEQAKVGFVAAYPYAEVISGYTAFFLGVRSVVPEAVMEVIEAYDGVLPFVEKVSPEVINREFGLSKNAFKRALGRLLKEGRVEIGENRVYKIK